MQENFNWFWNKEWKKTIYKYISSIDDILMYIEYIIKYRIKSTWEYRVKVFTKWKQKLKLSKESHFLCLKFKH